MSDAGHDRQARCRRVTIPNSRGLHARASAKFVKEAETFDADVIVRRDGLSADGISIMALMTLGAAQGMTIEICASGAEADAALDALATLVADGFGERD